MIKVENVETWGFEHAIRGMRNPYNSWEKSDTYFPVDGTPEDELATMRTLAGDTLRGDSALAIGDSDLKLMRRLYAAGTPHRKYLRQIFVSMDVTAPLYWWKQADQSKVGVVTNSCSTMHTIHKKPFELGDFSHEHIIKTHPFEYSDAKTELVAPDGEDTGILVSPLGILEITIGCLNNYRKKYLETEDKEWWWQMIQLLPSSYNQKRTLTMDYENVVSIINQRDGHKLDEWRDFVGELRKLPYITAIMADGRKCGSCEHYVGEEGNYLCTNIDNINFGRATRFDFVCDRWEELRLKGNRHCGNCRWHEYDKQEDDGSYVCINMESECFSVWTTFDNVCDDWEERK